MNRHHLISGEGKLPKLVHNAIHVWRVPIGIGQDDLQALAELLAPDESTRAKRFHFERDRRRFTVCRGCLRLLAAAYTGEDAVRIRFRYEPQGKPELASSRADEVQFNVSHSGELALLAFSLGRRLGVDVEFMQRELDVASLAETSFSNAECATVLGLSGMQRANLFFEYWTCKEACIKADGRGLSVPLAQFSVIPSHRPGWREIVVAGLGGPQPETRIRILEAGIGYAAAVAALDADWDAVLMDLE